MGLSAGAAIELPGTYTENAFYVVSGAVKVETGRYPGGVMAVACPNSAIRLEAEIASHVMVIGGDPLGERHIWWNFVSSAKDRIEQAKADWRAGRFDGVPGDPELIPLPD